MEIVKVLFICVVVPFYFLCPDHKYLENHEILPDYSQLAEVSSDNLAKCKSVRALLLSDYDFPGERLGWGEIGSVPYWESSQGMQWSWGSWGSCAGQWVVCLACHHSIPVLGGKVSLTFSFLVRLNWKGSQKGDLDWTAFMGWGALNSACPLGWPLWAPPNLGLLVEKWARGFSKGADTSSQLKQTNSLAMVRR